MNYVKVTSPDVNNGVGNRVTLWVSGCTHNCKGCHNKWLQDYKKGKPLSEAKDKIYEALSHSYIKGLTVSGGDPLDQNTDSIIELYNLLSDIKKDFPDKDIWLFSGFTMNELFNDCYSVETEKQKLLKLVDYFVDGRFVAELKDVRLPFRGSSNQKIWKNNWNGSFEIVDDEYFKN
jgi:anaerobic ribonucleoside-triphosphate reductase activating protein